MVHFEPLDKAITWSIEHPGEHSQRHYFRRTACGTTACIAGRVVIQAGYQPDFSVGGDIDIFATRHGVGTGTAHGIAMRLLDLTDDQASQMFIGAQNIVEVIDVRNEWARQAGVPERTWNLVPAWSLP